jgi:hypothetical protein
VTNENAIAVLVSVANNPHISLRGTEGESKVQEECCIFCFNINSIHIPSEFVKNRMKQIPLIMSTFGSGCNKIYKLMILPLLQCCVLTREHLLITDVFIYIVSTTGHRKIHTGCGKLKSTPTANKCVGWYFGRQNYWSLLYRQPI